MRNYDRYLHPEEITDREEITSHSSLLTNRRLDVMFSRLDEARVDAWDNPCVPTIRFYFAILSGIYNNVFPVFNDEENKKIKTKLDEYHEKFFSLFGDVTNKYQLCYDILFNLDYVQKMIIGFLQKRGYFFRMGRPQIKGIDQALAMYEKREREKEKK